jgi:hypothetical protein
MLTQGKAKLDSRSGSPFASDSAANSWPPVGLKEILGLAVRTHGCQRMQRRARSLLGRR